MAPNIGIDDLKVGMFVHLDLGWWAHPFALSSFLISSPAQIATIRGLGLQRLRWSPEKSLLGEANETEPQAAEGPAAPVAAAAPEAPASGPQPLHQTQLAAQRQAEQLCARQLAEARAAWQQANDCLLQAPAQARHIAQQLNQAVLDKLLGPDELRLRVMADAGGNPLASHALNVMLLALMVGRACDLPGPELADLGLGALLHDLGKHGRPAGLQHPAPGAGAEQRAAYEQHVALGVAHGQRMGLPPAVLQVLAQHHEMADGSGFPQRLTLPAISRPARVVALVNRYDRLCNPPPGACGLTPHEALAALFAQSRTRFDGVLLQSFIRMMGVYPPGSVVQLSDGRHASVVSVKPSRPLRPQVLVADLAVPPDQALLLDLDLQPHLGIRRSLKPSQLPAAVADYLSPLPRMVYGFEPAPACAAAMALPSAPDASPALFRPQPTQAA